MWQCIHEPCCTDQSRYTIVRERACTEDKEGNVVDADPSPGEVVHADCTECHAEANWIE